MPNLLNLNVRVDPYDLAGSIVLTWGEDDVMELIEHLDGAVGEWSFTKRVYEWARGERADYISEHGKAAWNDLA